MAIGTPVTTEVNLYCGQCWYCKQNKRHLCSNKDVIGFTIDGGLAEYISVPVDLVHVLPEGVDTTMGTFIEPLSSAIQTFRRVPAEEDEPVVVVGSGKVGLLVSQVYDAFGADVYLLGQNMWQLGLARTLGFRNTLNTDKQDWKSKVLSATHGVGARVVVDCSGTLSGFNTALDLVRGGGQLALMSTHDNGIPIETSRIVKRDITLVGNSSGPFEKAIDMLAKGRIEVNKLISREFALEEGREAFEYAAKPEAAKVIIHI
jgi:alcohol dehydrogenase